MRLHFELASLGILVAAAAAPAMAAPGETTCVSTDGAGNLDDNPYCIFSSAVDETGTLVFFSSFADSLVAGDTNHEADLFLKDLTTGSVSRIVMGLSGAEPDGWTTYVDVSADGNYVAFQSGATNLVPGDSNDEYDIFVLDRSAGTIERVNVSITGAEADAYSFCPSISDDGRFVLFISRANNLVRGDTVGTHDVFLRDRKLGETTCVSIDLNGDPGTGDCYSCGITGKGTTAFFDSVSKGLVAKDTNVAGDCFMRDLENGVTTRVSLGPNGAELDGDSYDVAFTDDLDWLAFTSVATNLIPGYAPAWPQTFLRNLLDGRAFHVSRNSAGEEANSNSMPGNRVAYLSTHAGNEPIVTFNSRATNLGPGVGANMFTEPWAHRPFFGTTQCLDVASDGTAGDGIWASAESPVLAADATFALINSDSGNFVTGDTNGDNDLFRRELLWTTFEEFGVGLAGSGGHVPHLFGLGGACEAGYYSLHVEDGLGGAFSLLWIGFGTTDLAAFGGHFYVDLSLPFLTLPVVLGGAAGVAGDGSFDLTGPDLSDVAPLTMYLQSMIVDPAAPKKLSLSNALAMHIGD